MKYDATAIGKNIRKLRTAAGMTQTELAQAINSMNIQTEISHYETGRSLPSVASLIIIADALNCSMEDIFGNAT